MWVSYTIPLSLSPSPDKVGADFTLEVEVYCSLPPEEPVPHNKPSTPIKMLKRLRGNKVVSVLHRGMVLICIRSVQDRSEEPGVSGVPSSHSFHDFSTSTPPHRFALAGHAHFNLTHVSQTCKYVCREEVLCVFQWAPFIQDLCAEAWSSRVKWDSQHRWPRGSPPPSVGTDLLQAHGPARLCYRAQDLRVHQPTGIHHNRQQSGYSLRLCVCVVCAAYGEWPARLDPAVVCHEAESSAMLEKPRGCWQEDARTGHRTL